jgi:hypothetical protein
MPTPGIFEVLIWRITGRLMDHTLGRVLNRPDRLDGRLLGIISVHSGKAVDAPRGSDRGVSVQQWSWHGGANQLWKFRRTGRRTYRIQSASTGLYLEVYEVAKRQGASIVLWNWNGGSHQQWRVVEMAAGVYEIRACHSDLYLDLSDWSCDDGARIQQWPHHGGANQRWELRERTDASDAQ